MNPVAWACAVLTLVSVDAVAIAYLTRWRAQRGARPESWFDHTRFLDRVRAYAPPQETIVHPCSYGGDLLEYPVARGWDEEAILTTLAEIEAL